MGFLAILQISAMHIAWPSVSIHHKRQHGWQVALTRMARDWRGAAESEGGRVWRANPPAYQILLRFIAEDRHSCLPQCPSPASCSAKVGRWRAWRLLSFAEMSTDSLSHFQKRSTSLEHQQFQAIASSAIIAEKRAFAVLVVKPEAILPVTYGTWPVLSGQELWGDSHHGKDLTPAIAALVPDLLHPAHASIAGVRSFP